jgi:oligopeptide/dipeptide ABC transporter ATP-binding protein
MTVRLPTDLSGGEKQRIGVARALALNPKAIILDEPTSALDVSVQAKILSLLKGLQQKLQLTYLLVTHNLSLGKVMADHIIVMYLGRIVERGETETLFRNPLHPYTRALLSAIPVITEKERRLIPEEILLEGELPSPANIPSHCTFLSRCQEKRPRCKDSPEPILQEMESNHCVRCSLYN